MVIAIFFYASLLVPGHTSAGFKALGFSGDFSPKFQVRFSICCLGDVVHLLRWFQPAPQSCMSGGSCSCLMVRRDVPALRTLRLKHSSVPAHRKQQQGLPFSSPGIPEGPSHQTVVSVFLTVRLQRCCRIRLFSLRYLRGRMHLNNLCKLSTQIPMSWSNGNENFPNTGKFLIF